jgi:hypothetical protein
MPEVRKGVHARQPEGYAQPLAYHPDVRLHEAQMSADLEAVVGVSYPEHGRFDSPIIPQGASYIQLGRRCPPLLHLGPQRRHLAVDQGSRFLGELRGAGKSCLLLHAD